MRFDPRRADFAPYGLTCVRWTPSVMGRPDRHNEIELNLLENGSITYLLGGRKVKIEANSLAIFWAAIPHQIIDLTGRHSYYVVTIPLAWFLQCGLGERLTGPVLHGQVVSQSLMNPVEKKQLAKDQSTADAELFGRWLVDHDHADVTRRRAMMLELEARLLRLAFSLPRRRKMLGSARHAAMQAERLTKAEQIACFVAQHYLEPLSVEQIGNAVGLHPNYAMNTFKRAFSTTITEYIRQHRIFHAQRLLAKSEEKILSVALSSGFGSISHFNDAFRRACGVSPREYRRAHRA